MVTAVSDDQLCAIGLAIQLAI